MLLGAGAAQAGEIDGAALSVAWGVPFVGMLLSIALMPLLLPRFWHHHFGKVTAGWALAFLLPFTLAYMVAHSVASRWIPRDALGTRREHVVEVAAPAPA